MSGGERRAGGAGLLTACNQPVEAGLIGSALGEVDL